MTTDILDREGPTTLQMKHADPTEVKFDDDLGTVEAVFATLNVIDKDGDVTLPGFFGSQDVAIAWAHDRSKLVGKGRITEVGDRAIMRGRFFLDTTAGKEAYLTTKAMGDLQEWSYGFYVAKGGAVPGVHDDQAVTLLQPLPDGSPGAKVAEVSPVLVGAGEGTHTTTIKSDGSRFLDQAVKVATDAEMLFGRASEISEMRSVKGKQLGEDAVANLLDVKTRLEAVATMIGDLVSPAIPDVHPYQLLAHSAHRVVAEATRLIGDNS